MVVLFKTWNFPITDHLKLVCLIFSVAIDLGNDLLIALRAVLQKNHFNVSQLTITLQSLLEYLTDLLIDNGKRKRVN